MGCIEGGNTGFITVGVATGAIFTGGIGAAVLGVVGGAVIEVTLAANRFAAARIVNRKCIIPTNLVI